MVVDFHSLEDRIVKTFFNEMNGKNSGTSRYMPVAENKTPVVFSAVSKAVFPTAEESAENPRARSAKLRFAVKAPALNREGDTHD